MRPSEEAARNLYKIFEKVAIRIAEDRQKNCGTVCSLKEQKDGEKE